MSDKIIDTFNDEEMVAWANASLERTAELKAEIERLDERIAKLQVVVDAAEAYRLADFKDQEETGQELDRALATLEDE